MTRTCWLASYPRSGNTWMRLLLAHVLFPTAHGHSVNAIPLESTVSSSRAVFDEVSGLPSAWLSPAEIDDLRPAVDAAVRARGRHAVEGLQLRKAHDACRQLPSGRWLMGAAPDCLAIYVMREPWDVAVSFAAYFGVSFEEAVTFLERPTASLAHDPDRWFPQLPQILGTWADHVNSWHSAPMPVHFVHYDALRRDTLATLEQVVQFLGLRVERGILRAAVSQSAFNVLRAQEHRETFREATTHASFFRRGESGEGLTVLTPLQLARLRRLRDQVSLPQGNV